MMKADDIPRGEGFGLWVRQQRRARDLTQEELAGRVGCSADMIFKLETGRASASERLRVRLAGALTTGSTANAGPRSTAVLPFGAWIAARRKACDLSQRGLAELLTYSEETIGAIEAGRSRPSKHLAKKLADVLGIAEPEQPNFIAWARGVAGATEPPKDSTQLGNIPKPTTRFVNRTQEVAILADLLARTDKTLVTLTGPGGVGKTRLALEVTEHVRSYFPDGAWFVDLSVLNDSGLVLPTIATVLKVAEEPNKPLAETLRDYLRPRRMLLVLDNFEHVLEAATDLYALLSTSKSKGLVTSRASLQVETEREFAVRSLVLPYPQAVPSPSQLEDYPALCLFVERVQDALPGFVLTTENLASVAEICARLDGLPLAIELAAARCQFEKPQVLVERLSLNTLVSERRCRPARQETLSATMRWSYNLLSPTAQVLFVHLSVFTGGCTLEGAEAVVSLCDRCVSGAHGLSLPEVYRAFTLLDHHNLLRRTDAVSDEPRFMMMGMIRQYGLDLLEEHGETQEIKRAHALYFLSLAEQDDPHLQRPQLEEWLNKVETEQNNIRSALGWALTQGESEIAIRMSIALAGFWWIRGYPSEGKRWIEQAISIGAKESAAYLAAGLTWLALLSRDLGDITQAESYQQTALDLYRELGDKVGIARSYTMLGISARKRADPQRALLLLEQSLPLLIELDDKEGMASTLNTIGTVSLDLGEYQAAERFMEQALSLYEELDNKMGRARALTNLGEAARCLGDATQANAFYIQSLEQYQSIGNRGGIAMDKLNLGYLAAARGELSTARELFADSLRLSEELSDKMGVVLCVAGLAIVASSAGEGAHAARLFGAVEAVNETFEVPIEPSDRLEIDRAITQTRICLGEAAWKQTWTEGRTLSLSQAVASAIPQAALENR